MEGFMSFFDTIGGSVSNAFKSVVERNRKAALINRVKIVIKAEEQNAERAYIALGKYYYQNLRDETNGDTELYCELADRANKRLARAGQRLTELLAPDAVLKEDEDPLAGADDVGCPVPAEEDPYEPMSELTPEEDVLDGDATEAAEESEDAETDASSASEETQESPKEAADDADDEVIPWA